MIEGVSVKPEERPQQGLEILDSEKLGKYGAVYGRFLLASLPGADTANIIDQYKTVEFNVLTVDTLKDRNYNPVVENFSLDERREEWKGVEYSQAYSQWRTKFTDFMTRITDTNKETALMMIMSNPKNAVEFTENDAGQLFTEFCSGGSNIANFIERVKTNLISEGKINPISLQELLPHLQWIASGLFGKNTASIAVTRLIELESALHNNPEQVMEFFNSNKERISMPTDDEKKILIPLYQSLIRQENKAVTIDEPTLKPAPVSQPQTEEPNEGQLEIKPPPNIPGLEEEFPDNMSLLALEAVGDEILSKLTEKDQNRLCVLAANMTEDQMKNMSPEERAKAPSVQGVWIRMYTVNLRKILEEEGLGNAQPQPAAAKPVEGMIHEESSIPGFVATPIEGSDKFRITINGKDTGIKWFLDKNKTDYFSTVNEYGLVESDNFPEFLDLPEGTGCDFRSKDFKRFRVKGGKDIKIPLSEGDFVIIDLLNRVDKDRASVYDNIELGKVLQVEDNITIDLADFRKPLEPQPSATSDLVPTSDAAPTAPIGHLPGQETDEEKWERMRRFQDTVVARELASFQGDIGVKGELADLPNFLNEHLKASDQDHATFSFSPDQLKEYMISIAEDFDIKGGNIKVGNDDQITISDLRITKLGVGVTLDLVLNNDKDGIAAKITRFHRDFMARANKASSREEVEKQVGNINSAIKKRLDEEIKGSSGWKTKKASILDGKVLVEFEKS